MTEEEKRLQQNPQNQSTEQAEKKENSGVSVPEVTPGISQDAEISNESYMQALSTLQSAQSAVPTYAGTYDAQLEDIYQQIVNRDKFSYDLNADMLYEQYKDQYVNMGRLAMKDTMGQAAALTGGYGSSYGQAAGQQQYDAYLQRLNDVVPELYGIALDRYNAEGDRLANMYAITGDMAADEYGKYQDSLAQYWKDREYNYGNLMSLISSTGYSPTADEIAAAGMTQEQVDLLLKTWRAQNPDLALQNGTISPEEYAAITGNYPGGGGGGWERYPAGDGGTGDYVPTKDVLRYQKYVQSKLDDRADDANVNAAQNYLTGLVDRGSIDRDGYNYIINHLT